MSSLIATPSQFRQALDRRRAHRAAERRAALAQPQAAPAEWPGRRNGATHGSFVTDLAETKSGILLCSGCQHRFSPSRYGYYKTREFAVQGRCDACKTHHSNSEFFIHESLLGRQHGQCWTPR